MNLVKMAGQFLMGVLFFSSVFAARGEIVAEYKAPEDPTSPNFGWASAGRSAVASPIETPEPAWRIAPQEGLSLNYSFPKPDALLQEAFAKGWKYSARVRLDLASAASIGRHVVSLGVENQEKKQAFVLWVRTTDGNAELMVELNGKTYPLPGATPGAFHDYAMIYDPVSASVSLLVDGQMVSDNIAPATTERWYLRWGHSSVSARGAAEWASVSFESPVAAKP